MDTKRLSCLSKLSINSALSLSPLSSLKPSNICLPSCRPKFKIIHTKSCRFWFSNAKKYRPVKILSALSSSPEKFYFTEGFRSNTSRKQRIVVQSSPMFNGGGGNNNNEQGRVVFNLAMAGALTYLTVTGKMGWVFDAIVSLWLFAVLVPVVGVVVFLWFAGRMVQGTCPNCGNEFQVFKFALMDDPQPCPYCTQPFTSKEFMNESTRFSTKGFGGFKQSFNGFTSGPKKQEPSEMVVDIDAEVKDTD